MPDGLRVPGMKLIDDCGREADGFEGLDDLLQSRLRHASVVDVVDQGGGTCVVVDKLRAFCPYSVIEMMPSSGMEVSRDQENRLATHRSLLSMDHFFVLNIGAPIVRALVGMGIEAHRFEHGLASFSWSDLMGLRIIANTDQLSVSRTIDTDGRRVFTSDRAGELVAMGLVEGSRRGVQAIWRVSEIGRELIKATEAYRHLIPTLVATMEPLEAASLARRHYEGEAKRISLPL
jgi:hypothetical protein